MVGANAGKQIAPANFRCHRERVGAAEVMLARPAPYAPEPFVGVTRRPFVQRPNNHKGSEHPLVFTPRL
jgi:hypothetical protein